MGFLREQLRELWSERRRVFWVALGVAWGTMSLTLLVAFGNSFVVATHQTINNFGEDLIRISGGSTTIAFQGLAAGRAIPLTEKDAQALREGLTQAQAVAIEFSSGAVNPISFEQVHLNVSLSGCGPQFQKLRGMDPQPGGRFINQSDVDQHRHVCFLGHKTKQRLFGEVNPVGKRVSIHGTPFLVVGVRKPMVSISGYNGDDREKVSIPYTAFQEIKGWRDPSFIMVGLKNKMQKQQAFDSIYQIMGARHRFDPSDNDALDIQDYMQITDRIDGMLDGNRYFNGIVGFFGLLVSVLGVMNVMYVLVEERSKEIGVRMALGASPGLIMRECLSEAVLVTLAGGVVGILFCIGAFYSIALIPIDPEARAYMGYPEMSWGLTLGVLFILTTAGCVAGWFPAKRAAMLDPIETLRED